MNDLAALLGGGAAPVAQLPSGPPAGPDPLAAALGAGGAPVDPSMMPPGAMPPGMDPSMMAMPGMANPADQAVWQEFPSTDPQAVDGLLGQLLQGQQSDQAAFQQKQMAAVAGSPLLQALMGGAPVGPGAGQDAQAIGPSGDIAPDPNLPA